MDLTEFKYQPNQITAKVGQAVNLSFKNSGTVDHDFNVDDLNAKSPVVSGGKTVSYAELARRIGRPKAVRAAGLANGRNPISIVVPCHRVIGSDGSLTGYGGGLPRKKWLLEHEGVRT